MKNHWFHVRLVSGRCGYRSQPYQRQLEALDGILGEYHNLVLLHEVLVSDSTLAQRGRARLRIASGTSRSCGGRRRCSIRIDSEKPRRSCAASASCGTRTSHDDPGPHQTAASALAAWRVALLAMLVESGADLLEPWPLKIVLDYVIGTKPPPAWLGRWLTDQGSRFQLLNVAAAAVLGIAIVGAISSYVEKYVSTTIGKRVGYDLRHALYHHVQRLSLSFYDGRQTGDLLVRLTADIASVEDFITGAVLGIVLDLVTLTGMLAVMFALDWRFSLIGLSIAPVLFGIAYHLMRRIKEAAREVKRRESDLASVVQESIVSARVVKAFAREEFEEGRVDRQSLASVDARCAPAA